MAGEVGSHTPVMLQEMMQCMAPQEGEVYVDATFGAGGYSEALLSATQCKVYAIDRDPAVGPYVRQLQEKYPGRVEFFLGRYAEMDRMLEEKGIKKVHGVVLDVGVSSMQLDRAERGFSFQQDGPLDMRMGDEGQTAEEFVNTVDGNVLADIIYQYGGEKKSRAIARAIMAEREKNPIVRTLQLAKVVRSVFPPFRKGKIDPATRTFQAIRIWINEELKELAEGLAAAERLLYPGGRLVVVTFHSLEDSIVKQFFRKMSGYHARHSLSRYLPDAVAHGQSAERPSLGMKVRKALFPSGQEIENNPRARSAKLRAAYKLYPVEGQKEGAAYV